MPCATQLPNECYSSPYRKLTTARRDTGRQQLDVDLPPPRSKRRTRVAAVAISEAREDFRDGPSDAWESSPRLTETAPPTTDTITASVWQYLSLDISNIVFRLVGERCFCSVRLVCRAWAEGLNSSVRELHPVSDALPPSPAWSTRFARVRGLDLSGFMCTEPATVLASLPHHLEHLSLPPLVTDSDLELITRMPNVNYLDFAACELLSGNGVATLFARGCFPRLRILDISGGHLMNTPGVEAIFQHLPLTLSYLDISSWAYHSRRGMSTTPATTQRLQWPESLKRLVLDGSDAVLDDDELLKLRSIRGLTSLALSGCLRLSDTGLASLLLATTQLSALNLSDCCGVGRRTVEAISKLTRLKELDLSGCTGIRRGDLSAHQLPRLEYHLRELSLSGTCIGDTDVMSLQALTNLTSLSLAGCRNATSAGVAALGKLRHLTHLNLNGCYLMTHRSLLTVGHLRSLTSLELAGCHMVTDQGLCLLAGLSNLRSLNLSCCDGMDNSALTVMRPLFSLTSLNLSHCFYVSDPGLVSLLRHHHRRLKYLGLVGCFGVSDQMLHKLRDMPDIFADTSW